ncbi:DUF6779 domain-containing protein [Saccharomonospora sp. NB11]|uniref:DUF6779 domain-containing protein n=1 Tax=Saccharomonospora sp. NB11 TaxID=1642298 RepID=UPI0018D0F12E|nr:DUF6779 domain-containing protein [Saccharomonospora sp. NB11]
MSGVGEDSRDRSAAKPWLAVGFLLAIGATLALVLTDDLRWIRLAVVAALWAALIGALMAAKYRKQAAVNEKSVAKAQKIYELELQKEIAARREHELEIEAETRRRVEEEKRDELEALREELRSLRDNLQNLFGGEVLWERVALTAQSTRMRKLGDDQRLVTAGEAEGRPALTVDAEQADQDDPPTELIGRIRDLDAEPEDDAEEPMMPRVEPPRRREPGAGRSRFVPRSARPAEDMRQQPGEPAARRVPPRPGSALARASEAASRARAEMSRPQQRPVAPPNGPAGPAYAPRRPADAEAPRPPAPPREGHLARSLNPETPARPQQPAVEEAPTRTQRAVDPRTAVTPPVRPGDTDGRGTGYRAPVEPPRRPMEPRPTESPAEATVAARVDPPAPTQPEPNPTLPPEVRDATPSGGRRRRPEPDEPAPSSGGGRRRRDDDEKPAWLDSAASGARHSHAEESEPEPAGSHSEGRSVSELLAAYGASGSRPRRRRRADD